MENQDNKKSYFNWKWFVFFGIIILTILIIGVYGYTVSKNKWDSVRVYYNLSNEYVEISKDSAENLEEFLWDYEFKDKTINENEEALYGGNTVMIEFVRENEIYRWAAGQSRVSYTEIVDDVIVESHLYDGEEWQIYNKIMNLVEEK